MACLPLFKTEGEALDFLKHSHVCVCMCEPACVHALVHVQVRPGVGPSELAGCQACHTECWHPNFDPHV